MKLVKERRGGRETEPSFEAADAFARITNLFRYICPLQGAALNNEGSGGETGGFGIRTGAVVR